MSASDTTGWPDQVKRLEELERLTRAYSRYSGLSGIPLAVLGAWALSGLVLESLMGRLLLLATPLAWVGAAALSAALYTRRGTVAERPGAHRQRSLAFLAIVGAAYVVQLARATWYLAFVPRGLAVALALVMLALVAAGAYRLVQTGRDAAEGMFAIVVATSAVQDAGFVLRGLAWVWAAMGALAVGAGIVGHFRFRTLERRMAALRAEEP